MWWMTFSEPKKMKENKVFFSAKNLGEKSVRTEPIPVLVNQVKVKGETQC